MIKLGLPIGLTIFIEVGMFSFLALLVGRLGVEAVAAHQIANSMSGLTFMVGLALGAAASVRIGYNVGAEDTRAARRSGAIAIGVSLVFALLVGARNFLRALLAGGSFYKGCGGIRTRGRVAAVRCGLPVVR